MITTHDKPETRIIPPVRARLEEGGFQTFAEVLFESRHIDMVADNEEQLIVAEAKMQLDSDVIEQARLSQGVADLVFIVVPPLIRMSDEHSARLKMIEAHGLGLTYSDGRHVKELIEPAPNHNAQAWRLRAVLHPGQQTMGQAGSQHDRWSPTGEWIRNIRKALDEHGSIWLIEAYELQPSNRQRVAKGSVPRVIHQLIDTGRLPFATIEEHGGKSLLRKL
jgi:hypothetical protein